MERVFASKVHSVRSWAETSGSGLIPKGFRDNDSHKADCDFSRDAVMIGNEKRIRIYEALQRCRRICPRNSDRCYIRKRGYQGPLCAVTLALASV